MKKRYKLMSGSFYEGCGITIVDIVTNNYYNKIVFEETDTKRLYISMGTPFNPIKVYEEEITITN